MTVLLQAAHHELIKSWRKLYSQVQDAEKMRMAALLRWHMVLYVDMCATFLPECDQLVDKVQGNFHNVGP